MSDARILEMVDIFTELSSESLEQIYSICSEKRFVKGDLIVEEYTPSTEIYILIDGEVEVVVGLNSADGPKRVATMDRGYSFGEVALVDQGLRMASVRCISDECCVLVINRDDLMNLLQENLQMGFVVMQNLAIDLCWKIRQTQYMAQDGVLYTPRQK